MRSGHPKPVEGFLEPNGSGAMCHAATALRYERHRREVVFDQGRRTRKMA